MKSYRCRDWSILAGMKVEVRRNQKVIRTGVVETVMPDAGMFWLSSDYNGDRTLFESAEGYEVWADPDDIPDGLYWPTACRNPSNPVSPEKESSLNAASTREDGSLG